MFVFVKQKTEYEMRISGWSSDVCSSDLFMRKPSQSLLASKDCEGFLMNFAVLVCRVIAVPIQQDTALPSEEIAQVARCVGIPAETRDSVGDAQIGRATCRESGCQYA